jgi:hypothetical protein
MPPFNKREGKVGEILNDAALYNGKNVKKDGKLVTFEDRKWPEKRSWEVSEAILDAWREKAKKWAITFDDLVDIACLTDGQIKNTIQPDIALSNFNTWSIWNDRQLLRFYAVLSDPQKAVLSSEDGLYISMLDPTQLQYFDTLLEHEEGKSKIKPGSILVMTMEPSEFSMVFNLEDRSAIIEEPANSPKDIEGDGSVNAIVEPPSGQPAMTRHFQEIGNWYISIPRKPSPEDETPPEAMPAPEVQDGSAPQEPQPNSGDSGE